MDIVISIGFWGKMFEIKTFLNWFNNDIFFGSGINS